MRKILFSVVSLIAIAIASCEPAYAGVTINAQGTGGAPVPVTTSAVVTIIAAGDDVSYCFWSEGQDLRCAYGDPLGNAPPIEPTASLGLLFPYVKGVQYCEGSIIARRRLDCIAVSTNTSVDTKESQ